MRATIRRYEAGTRETEELARAARLIASELSEVPGFVSFLALKGESSEITMISLFEDDHSPREADRLVWASVPARLPEALLGNPQIITGTVIFQRGL